MLFKIVVFVLSLSRRKYKKNYWVALPKQEKENDASGRKAPLLRERVCEWVDVWPLSLASSPAPHVTHSLGPNVDEDRKTDTGLFYYALH